MGQPESMRQKRKAEILTYEEWQNMSNIILLDFGSTFTKAAVVSLEEKKIIFTTKSPSTVQINAKIGLDNCYRDIREALGEEELKKAKKLATSSAAGGLRMIVVGLTENLSISAGRNASFSAGAKILKSYSGLLTSGDIEEMDGMNAEILLLCGGYEDGNITGVLHNADMLGSSKKSLPIIYSGNSAVMQDVRTRLYLRHKECLLVENIIPRIGQLNAKPTAELIRHIFMERITNMKGLDIVKNDLESVLMPTPASVLAAGNLLSRGYDGEKGLGPLMIVDIGGATTDIHTYAEFLPYGGAKCIGAPEPYAKRTVEGDLGMRESSELVIREIGFERASQDLNIPAERLKRSIHQRLEQISFLPKNNPGEEAVELLVDQQIAKYAAFIAARRHAGKVEAVHSKVCSKIQTGKNLAEIKTVIGTGGPVVNSKNPREILEQVVATELDDRHMVLLPRKVRTMIDSDYVLYAAGILGRTEPETALRIMKDSIIEV